MLTFWRKQMAEYKNAKTNNDNTNSNNETPYTQYDCECCHCKKIFMMLDKAVSEKQEQREVIAKNPNARNM